MEYPKFKVTVSCMTYNQSKFITDAMNGFTMQQTSFPFVCTIVDDASTDGEQNVIKQYVEEHFDLSDERVSYTKETDYANIIYAQHKTNKNCYFAVLFLKENHFSQKKRKDLYLKEWIDNIDYLAFCEGDDFWIDPLKLKKQVDVLDSDNKIMMVHTAFNYIDENSKTLKSFEFDYNIGRSHSGFLFAEYLYRNIVQLVSCVIRYNITKSNIFIGHENKYDYLYFMCAASLGRVYYINEKMCCYRCYHKSITHTNRNRVQKDILNITDYFTKLFYKNIIFMDNIDRIKTNTYIAAKGIHMILHGQECNYFVRYILSNKRIIYTLPGLLLEIYLTLHYNIKKIIYE